MTPDLLKNETRINRLYHLCEKMKNKLKIGVLVSGSGSNLQSIIDNIEKGLLDAVITVVVSNNPRAYAIERAKTHQIPSVVLENKDYGSRDEFDCAMVNILKSYSVELVVMAGFMRVLSPVFLNSFHMKIMNIHPAVLPSFPGIHAQKRAAEYGVKFSGCTVHFADEGVDTGPVIIQAIVPAYDDDTEATLAARILREEHRIYPQAIQFYAEGRIEVKDRKVHIEGIDKIPAISMHNPSLIGF
jgi:phosphoribosylglycinamide formyltransferase-1